MKAFEIRSIFIASSIAAALILSSFSLVSARVIQPLHLIEQPATISGTPACQTLSKISNLYYYNTAKWKNALKGNDFQKAKATIHDALSTASYDPSGLPGSTYGEIEDVITRLNYSIDPIEAQRNVDLMSDLVRLVKPIACGTSSSGLTIRSSTYSIKFLEDIELATIASEQAKLGQEYQTAIALNACAIGDAVSRS